MGGIPNQSWTFDTVASSYEKMRPGYCASLYDALFDYIPIHSSSHVLEIGIGAGQATPPLLNTGCFLTAVECGANFAALCREKFRAFPRFRVINGRFENVGMENGAYDLVYSAAAFHWVPEEIGYRKVFDLLKPGGAFARFACHPDRTKADPALSEEIDRAYAQYYYPFYHKPPEKPQPYTEKQAQERAALAEKYGFADTRCSLFTRARTLNAQEYIQLLGTYSDHIALEEGLRQAFFAAIEQAILRHGGSITLHDTIDLELARKR